LNEGGSDCATIDAIMRGAGGFRMGPFELMDLIGHDVNYAVTRSVFDAFYGDPRFKPSLRQLELVEAGFLGRKTGRGFYKYGEGAASVPARTSAACVAPGNIRLAGNAILTNALANRLDKNSIPYQRIAEQADGRIAEADGAVLFLSDGRTANLRAKSNDVANTVLVDLTLAPSTATHLAISAADSCSSSAITAATGLLQAAEYMVSEIDDIPGMVVLRTVAMLANEAADAVHQGVCNASDCDLAMRNGVNYPMGPLEWADQLGPEAVVKALDNLREAYGDARYRVSPLLRRKAITQTTFHQTENANHA
jgi:3-hydroxybutyryl-CoA dehydrogenase